MLPHAANNKGSMAFLLYQSFFYTAKENMVENRKLWFNMLIHFTAPKCGGRLQKCEGNKVWSATY